MNGLGGAIFLDVSHQQYNFWPKIVINTTLKNFGPCHIHGFAPFVPTRHFGLEIRSRWFEYDFFFLNF